MALAKRIARKPRRSYHHGNLRRALLDEALVTIRDKGIEGLTLREIGARLGVSRTALYRHFADKQALLTAVATEGFLGLRQRLIEASEECNGRPGASQAMGVAYIRFAVENPSHYRVMFSRFVDPKPKDPQLAAEAGGAFQVLVDAVAALQQQGLVHRDDPVLIARFVWSVVHGVAMLAIDGQIAEPGGVDELTRYALRRLGTAIAANPGLLKEQGAGR
jgi:AcrR family transcriptional regulator